MMRAAWLEDDAEFEGVGAHVNNPRYDPVDEPEGSPTMAKRFMRNSLVAPVHGFLDASVRFDGMDGSHHNLDAGPINWFLLKEASLGSWIAWKATQSIKYVDPTFLIARAAAAGQGFKYRLWYHWLSSTTDPVAQAKHFVATVGHLGDGGAMLDAEEAGITVEMALAWLEYVESIFHKPCSVYTGIYVAGGSIWDDDRLRMSAYGPRTFHVAAYITEANLIKRIGNRKRWDAWQSSSDGQIPGVMGRGDRNRIDNFPAYDLVCGIAPEIPEEPEAPEVTFPDYTPVEEDMKYIATNSEVLGSHPVGEVKFSLEAGKLRHLSYAEWRVLGSVPGVPLTNAEIAELGGTVS